MKGTKKSKIEYIRDSLIDDINKMCSTADPLELDHAFRWGSVKINNLFFLNANRLIENDKE